jgi:hypothetical protein
VNTAVINVGVQLLSCMLIQSFGSMPKRSVAGSLGRAPFSLFHFFWLFVFDELPC